MPLRTVRNLCRDGLWHIEQRVEEVARQVGESARDGDMDVNPVREKKLTNVRSAGNDEKVQAHAPTNRRYPDLTAACVCQVSEPCGAPRGSRSLIVSSSR